MKKGLYTTKSMIKTKSIDGDFCKTITKCFTEKDKETVVIITRLHLSDKPNYFLGHLLKKYKDSYLYGKYISFKLSTLQSSVKTIAHHLNYINNG